MQESAGPQGVGSDSAQEAVPSGFQVKVNGVSLVDLLQMFHMSRRSVTVRLPQGLLYVRDGEVIHAECGGLEGEAAVRALLEVRGGELQTESLVPSPISVRRPLATVLLDALVYIDEQNDGAPPSTARLATSGEPASTRVEHWEAICATINRTVDGAVCSAVIDLKERSLLGGSQCAQLSELGQDALLDLGLSLFSCSTFGPLEQLLREGAVNGAGEFSKTQESYTHRGGLLYIGRRLTADKLVLVVCATTSLPALPMAQLKAILSAAKSPS